MSKDKDFLNFGQITENLIGFAETKIELIKLDAKEKLSLVLAKIAIASIVFFSLILMLIFLSIAVALRINILLESSFLGFLSVAGVYLVIILCFNLFIDKQKAYQVIAKKINKILSQNED